MTHKAKGGMPWYRAYVHSMLRGSVPNTMSLEQQMVWWKLLALARESKCRDGTLRHGFGVPMDRRYIAHECGCPIETLNRVIEMGQSDRNLNGDGCRIKVWPDGTIELCNFLDYNPEAKPTQATLPPAVEEKPPLPDVKRRAIHNRFQKDHPEESEFHLGLVKAGLADDGAELREKKQKEDRRFIRDMKNAVKGKGQQGLPPPRFKDM